MLINSEDSRLKHCIGCRERPYCIINQHHDTRKRRILNDEEASTVEIAIEAIRDKESFLTSLREELETQLRLYRQDGDMLRRGRLGDNNPIL